MKNNKKKAHKKLSQDEPTNEVGYGPEGKEEPVPEPMNSTTMKRANEIFKSDMHEAIAHEELVEGEESMLEQRPRIATRVQAKFINHFLRFGRRRIDAELQAERTARSQAMYQQVNRFLQPEGQEEKIYQEQLKQQKQADIFARPSSSDFLKLLQPESEDPTSSGQVKAEKFCSETEKVYTKPFQNKMTIQIDKPVNLKTILFFVCSLNF